jgi:hypothetical protein
MPDATELTAAETEALHDCRLAVEHLYRAYGTLLAFHHRIGHAMDALAVAESTLRDAGHDDVADELRDRHLPAGPVDDRWTYELVEAFEDGLLAELAAFDERVREDLAGGRRHVAEAEQKRRWRERAAGEAWRHESD